LFSEQRNFHLSFEIFQLSLTKPEELKGWAALRGSGEAMLLKMKNEKSQMRNGKSLFLFN
jgi:hypothetical protein